MIDAATWLAFLAAAIIVAATPGPTAMLLVSYGLALGRHGARLTVPAVMLGDLTAMTLSLAGMGVLLAASPRFFSLLASAGAAYLVFLGVRMWRMAPTPATASGPPPRCAVMRHLYLVTALNPKSIAFYVAFLPQFVAAGRPAVPQLAVLALTFLTVGAVNAMAYALAAGQAQAFFRRPQARQWLNRAGGTALIAAAALLAFGHRIA